MHNIAEFKLIKSKYPHIAEKIELLWGYPEFYLMFEKLFADTRNGTRRGFPTEDANAILRLIKIHDKKYPHMVPPSEDIWYLHHRL